MRKALENTSVPIGDSPEDKLSAGQGLMQVDKFDIFPVFILKKIAVNCNIIRFVIDFKQIINDRCYEYIQQSRNIPCVWYQINIYQSGKSSKFTSFPGNFAFSIRETRGGKLILFCLYMNLFMLVQL